jgi:hypothetical protein
VKKKENKVTKQTNYIFFILTSTASLQIISSMLTSTASSLRPAARRLSSRAFSASGYHSEQQPKTEENFEKVLDHFALHRATAVLRTATSAACPPAMTAAIEGGFKICEFTLTTPEAMKHMHTFRKEYDGSDIMIGMGTIMSVKDAEMAVEGGAQFIITPVLIPSGKATHTTQIF